MNAALAIHRANWIHRGQEARDSKYKRSRSDNYEDKEYEREFLQFMEDTADSESFQLYIANLAPQVHLLPYYV